MKNSRRVNVKVAVVQEDEVGQRLMRVVLIAFAVVGAAAIVELSAAGLLALSF